MNFIFFFMVLTAFFSAGWRQMHWVPKAGGLSPMQLLTKSIVDGATGSVELALGLVGVMTLFLGLMKVAESGGMLTIVARLIRPVMVKLFPSVPPDHPAMGSMILNMSANALGLGNAATPFGIRAMQELDKLNPVKGTATDAMVLFLAINTSNVTLLPTGVIAIRAAAGSSDPAGILPTTLFATIFSTIIAIFAAKLYGRFHFFKGATPEKTIQYNELLDEVERVSPPEEVQRGYPIWVSGVALSMLILLIPVTVLYGRAISPWIIPGLMLGFLAFGILRKVPVYEVFVEGAKEGFQVAIRIIPYLVAILVAVAMLRASGAMNEMVNFLGVWTEKVGMPADALPMALLRPLSGSGAYGVMASILKDPAIGPDRYTGYLVSTLQGSTETTFYVLAVYFGAVQIKRVRHALAAALTADLAGIAAAVAICSFLYGR